MPYPPDEFGPLPARPADFATTHWSVVLDAGRGDSPEASAALDRLCRTYWYPIFFFVRRKGHTPEEAKDLTQEFFARLISRTDFSTVRREKGRFRSYLLTALKNFLINEWKRGQTRKRGGGFTIIPFDLQLAEDLYGRESTDLRTPESAFERRWALTILEKALSRLEAEYIDTGRTDLFNNLRDCLSSEALPRPQAEHASELGISEGALKQAVYRLRRRYRELIRQEIGSTVATPSDIEDELRHLISLLRS